MPLVLKCVSNSPPPSPHPTPSFEQGEQVWAGRVGVSRESRAGSKPEASPPAHSYSRASHLYPPTTIHPPANILNILDFFLISLNFFRICWKSKASIANCLSPTPCQHHPPSCKHQSVKSTAHSSNLVRFPNQPTWFCFWKIPLFKSGYCIKICQTKRAQFVFSWTS